MKRKRTILLSLICSLVLSGCSAADTAINSSSVVKSGSSGLADESTTYATGSSSNDLVVWGAKEDQELLTEIGTGFKKKYPDCPYTVSCAAVSESDAKSGVLSDVNNAPDVFTFADGQLTALAASGVLTPVDNKEISSRNIDAAVSAASINGKLYAYPLTADNGYFLYYNKAKLSDTDITTMDDILKKATSQNKKFTMDMGNGWYFYSFFGNTGMILGLNDDGITNHCTWNATTGAITGLDVAGGMHAIATNRGFKNGGDDILAAGAKDGSVIAGVSGIWEESELRKVWGDKLGAAKLPTYTAGGKQVQMASYAGYKLVGVNHYSSKEVWAEKFADYMTNEDNQTLRFEKRGQGPSNKKAAESKDVAASEAIQALLAQSDYASLQRVGGSFWTPASDFGSAIVSGKPASQKMLDTLVKGITAKVTD